MNNLIAIPARMASSRLTNKMMKNIGGVPLIVHTYQSVVAANVGDVIVACDCEEIAQTIRDIGGVAILTDPSLPSGTDRVFAAYNQLDNADKYDAIINVQGDLPFLDNVFIREVARIINTDKYDISTVATIIKDETYMIHTSVKSVIAFDSDFEGRALYFSRSPVPYGGPYYHHVGIYGFKVNALKKFVSLPCGNLENIEKLEQLRAIENGMTIGISVVDQETPISIDIAQDLNKAEVFYENMRA